MATDTYSPPPPVSGGGGTCLSDLPDCVVTEILVRLPLKAVLACKCVCKPWDRLLSAPSFAKLHFNQGPPSHHVAILKPNFHAKEWYLVNLEDQPHINNSEQQLFSCQGFSESNVRIYGSCNGLLLFTYHQGSATDDMYIYNPIVEKKIKLPATTYNSDAWSYHCISRGIGYSRVSDTYKVIRIAWPWDSHKSSHAEICVLGGEGGNGGKCSWKNVEDPIPMPFGSFERGLYHRGTIYWMFDDANAISICGFDIETEKFGLISCPPSIERSKWGTQHLSLWRGSMISVCHSDDGLCNIWVMKEYGKSWTKEIEMTYNGEGISLLGTLPNGEPILTNMCTADAFGYDAERMNLGELVCFKGCFLQHAYVPSLVSPEEL